MGCDYYIRKVICIYHTKGIYKIEIDSQRGWFSDYIDCDSDDEEYPAKYAEMLKRQKEDLVPKQKPILLYEKGAYLREGLEEKYGEMVKAAMTGCFDKFNYYDSLSHIQFLGRDSFKSMEDVIKITKEEERYLR